MVSESTAGCSSASIYPFRRANPSTAAANGSGTARRFRRETPKATSAVLAATPDPATTAATTAAAARNSTHRNQK